MRQWLGALLLRSAVRFTPGHSCPIEQPATKVQRIRPVVRSMCYSKYRCENVANKSRLSRWQQSLGFDNASFFPLYAGAELPAWSCRASQRYCLMYCEVLLTPRV